MEDRDINKLDLPSPEELSSKYQVSIAIQGAGLKVEISKIGGAIRTFELPGRSHTAYLDFFCQLATDFGTRTPQNRMRAKNLPNLAVPYQEVLTSNIAPGVLYGYGDPAVMRVDNGPDNIKYYLVATSNDAPDAFPLMRSSDLYEWGFVRFIFPEGEKPDWAADGIGESDYWAPELHQLQNEYLLCFVARDKYTRELCIGIAKSNHPEGPYRDAGQPILMGNVIDPHVYVNDNGTAYLYWKEDNNDLWPGLLCDLLYTKPSLINQLFTNATDRQTAELIITLWPWAKNLEPMERFQVLQVLIEAVIADFSAFSDMLRNISLQQPHLSARIEKLLQFMKTPMYAQQLSADASSLVGERVKVLENDQPWEAHLVEGMWVTRQHDCYYFFYAGNDFSTDEYGIGVAIGNSPLGPFKKAEKALLQSTAKWRAPGHPSVVTAPDGKAKMFLHAYYPGNAGYKQFRALLAIPLTFYPDKVIAG